MNSKKYNAAEKHFMKQHEKDLKKIKLLETLNKSAHSEINQLSLKVEHLELENEQLSNWVERLLEYSELSHEDIKSACEKDKKLAAAADMVSCFAKFF